ncbi:MAG: serine/threonine protein kinase [Verrucomicrobiales bacterium]|nr:serine/threonine protein kinase [Verrucomicrobiales bacterium]
MDEIARGGMGTVFRARQAGLDRLVAVKVVRDHVWTTPSDLRRFRAEAAAAGKLRHPNIVSIHEVGEHNGHHFYAMDLIEGPSLAERVRSGPLPGPLAARLALKITLAVQYAHEHNVLHRDLKPGNVLVDARGEPQVTDFGLARPLDGDSSLTVSGQIVGTPAYMSPEQARSSKELDARSDVYAIGALLYHLLTGSAPFAGSTLPETLRLVLENEPAAPHVLNPFVPADLSAVALRCLEKEPGRRYASAQELADDLARFLEGKPTLARAPHAWERAWKWARRRPALVALASLVVISTAMALVLEVRGRRQLASALHRAESLASSLTTNLATRLGALGQVQLLDEVNRSVADHFAHVDLATASPQTLLAFADFQRHTGDAHAAWNRLDAATTHFAQSVTVLERLPRSDSVQQQWLDIWLTAGTHWARSLRRTGRLAEALSVTSSLSHRIRNSEATGSIDTSCSNSLALYYLECCQLEVELGQLDRARQSLAEARSLVQATGKTSADSSRSAERDRVLAEIAHQEVTHASALGIEPGDACITAEQGCRLLDRWVADSTLDTDLLRNLVALRQAAGTAFLALRPAPGSPQAEEATRHFSEAVQQSRRMHLHDPFNLHWLDGLCLSLGHLARSHLTNQLPREAASHIAEALQLSQTLTTEGSLPKLWETYDSLVGLHAEALVRMHPPDVAQQILHDAAETRWESVLRSPGNRLIHRRFLAYADQAAYVMISSTATNAPGNLSRSAQEYDFWIHRLESAPELNPFTALRSESVASLAAASSYPRHLSQDGEAAIAVLTRSKNLRKELLDLGHERIEMRRALAESYRNLVSECWNSHRPREALQALDEVVQWIKTETIHDAKWCDQILAFLAPHPKEAVIPESQRSAVNQRLRELLPHLESNPEIRAHAGKSAEIAQLRARLRSDSSAAASSP